MLDEIILAIANLITSAFTAITGLGGGMILIGIMPLFLPAIAIIPLHAVTQLSGNASRAWFGRQDIAWQPMKPFLFGSILGMIICGFLVQFISLQLIPLFIGIYILLLQWSKWFNKMIRRFENFFVVGLLQTGLGVFVGTPGPLNIAVLNNHYEDNHVVVTTGALMMTVVHAGKLIVYLALGFSFLEYWRLLVMMMVMSIFGSWIGTKIRHKISSAWLKKILPYVLTLLAVKLIVDVLIKYIGG